MWMKFEKIENSSRLAMAKKNLDSIGVRDSMTLLPALPTELIVQSLYDIYEGNLKLIVYKRFSSDNCSLRGVFEHRKKSTKNFDWEHCKKFS